MSADNWAVCPRCLDRAKAESEARFQAAFDAYGKVPAAEYERLRAEAQAPVDEDSFETFREDYEIYGAKSGTITVSYSGHCQTCGLNIDFKHEHPFYEREERASVTVDDLLLMPPDAADALSEEAERGPS
jgi:hypothetical protein